MHPQITPSSGNVFVDMGHPHPQKALVKAKLAGRIATIIEERGLTREEAAEILGMGYWETEIFPTLKKNTMCFEEYHCAIIKPSA